MGVWGVLKTNKTKKGTQITKPPPLFWREILAGIFFKNWRVFWNARNAPSRRQASAPYLRIFDWYCGGVDIIGDGGGELRIILNFNLNFNMGNFVWLLTG